MLEDTNFGTKAQLGPNQEKFIAALESGKYLQGQACLKGWGKYCAFGVACELFAEGNSWQDLYIPPSSVLDDLAMQEFGRPLADNTGLESVVSMNDNGMSFADIAAHLREHGNMYFKEPK